MKKTTQRYMVIGLIGILAVAYLGNFLAPIGLPSPIKVTPTLPENVKTISVQGNYILPQGTALGAVGDTVFFDSGGNAVSSDALSASGAFSISVPSGETYVAVLTMDGGNAITYYQTVETVHVPEYSTDSEVTVWTISPSFTVYPKAVAWGIRFTFGTFAAGSTIQSFTANAWGGTQTYTSAPNLYTLIAAGTQYTMTIELACTTAYSQLGQSLSLPNYPEYTMESYMTMWTNRTAQDWTIVNPGTAQAFVMVVNGSTKLFVAKLPVVRSNAVAATSSVSFTILIGSAGQGQYGCNFVTNSSTSYLQASQDYKTNAPPGYGACFYGARFVTGHCG